MKPIYPLVEVRCERCTHYKTVHTSHSPADPVCNAGPQDTFPYYPCKKFRFKANVGLDALIHRHRLLTGLDRPNELDKLRPWREE